MATQWRDGGMDYAALPVVARLVGIVIGRKRFMELREMEQAALRALAERRKARSS